MNRSKQGRAGLRPVSFSKPGTATGVHGPEPRAPFRMARSLLLSLAVLMTLAGASAAFAQSEQVIVLDEPSGTVVKVTHLLSDLPPAGTASLRVSVTNGRNEPLAITLGAVCESRRGYRGSTSVLTTALPGFSTDAGATAVKEFTVPLLSGFGDSSTNLRVTVGSPLGSRNTGFSGERTEQKPFIGLSGGLAGKDLKTLQTALDGGSGSYRNIVRAASFDAAQTPADWRGWLGLDVLCMTADEWNRLDATRQLAVRQWVMSGGTLDLYHTGARPDAALGQLMAPKSATGDTVSLGHGTVKLMPWDGQVLEEGDMDRYKTQSDPARLDQNANALTRKTAVTGLPKNLKSATLFTEAMGERSFAAWQVGVILVLFGVMVGPVNLFYFAGPGKRHRVFYTTPLISLAASVILVAVIFLQDGSGGTGRRAAIVYVRAEDNMSYVRQYQVARTGALFGSSFSVPDTAFASAAMLPTSRWTRLDGRNEQEQSYTISQDGTHGGDWFQSRSEQALIVESLQPGRGRIERQPGSAEPVLVSRFGFSLAELWYLDEAGTWWKSDGPVATGATVHLTRAESEAADVWLRTALRYFPDREVNQLTERPAVPGFYATASDPAGGMLGTLPSIRWSDDILFLHGPVAETR